MNRILDVDAVPSEANDVERLELTAQIERMRKEVAVQNAINAFLKQSIDATSTKELLDGVLDLFPHLTFLGAEDRGAAFLMDEQAHELVMVSSRNLARPLLALCARVPVGTCLCGRAALTGQIQFASHIDFRLTNVFDGMQPHGHYNVPILVDGKVAGVIALYLPNNARKDLECLEFLKTAAAIVSGALKRLTAERQIRMSEEMRCMVIENTPCGIIAVDAQGVIQIFNHAAERLFGYRKDEICGEQIIRLVPFPLRGISQDLMQCCIDTNYLHILGQMPFEAEALRRDGSVFPIRLAINRMAMADGSSFIGMIVDMTEEKRLFDEVVQLERTIIESAPFGIVVADNEERIQVFNAAAEQLFGYHRDEIIGQPVSVLVPQGMLPRHITGFQHHLEAESRIRGNTAFESEACRKDGTLFPIRLAVNRMMMGGYLSFVGMIYDISEEKRLYDGLVQSEKMAGLGSMVAGVAHEINTPVGIGVTAASELEERTHAFVELLHGEGISEEELDTFVASTRRLAGMIRLNLERAADLVRSFKSVAVDQSSEKLRTFKVREYVESAVLTLHHELRHTKLIVIVSCAMDLEVRSHPGAFSQIVINLINNSRIHAFAPDETGQITMEFQEVGDRLHFTYRDNGKGMSEETRSHIFEPFYTTRRDLGGSGLGMHIVYNLATRTLGGTIACQSAPGCGMSILIDIPMVR
ncbi:MAG: PAS domain S-box protein [Magnetococcales bacterium]|nr:PAS domain S-box protein [Magnetococcales bacterium]